MGDRVQRQLVPDPDARHEPFPLTEIQQAYYVGRLAEGGAGASVYLEFEVDAADTARLESSWNLLVAETDMLRAAVQPDGTAQVRRQVEPYRIRVDDLRETPGREESLAALRGQVAGTLFDPHGWPPFEVRVALLPGDRGRVCLAVDEMVADGPSVSLLVQRWHQLYRGTRRQPVGLAFRDYALALTEGDDDPATARSLEYWRDKLSGLDLAAGSPLTRAAPRGDRPRERLSLVVPEPGWSRLKARARDWTATPSALLLAVYCAALRVRGEVDGPLPVVLTTYNRQPLHPDVPRVVGPFVSTSIFLAPPASGGLDEVVAATRRQLWEDLEHGRISGVRALRELSRQDLAQRGASVPVVFTSMLGSLVATDDDPDGWAARVDTGASVTRTPGVAIEAIAHEQDGALRLSVDFAPEAMERAVAEGVFRACEAALSALAGLPGDAPPPLVCDLLAGAPRRRPLTDVQSAYLVGRLTGGDDTAVYQEFRLSRHDPDRLEQAWRALVAHHPMLRAAVHEDGILTIEDTVPFSLARNDLTGRDGVADALARVRDRMTAQPLPLGRAPMFALEVSVLPDGSLVLHAVVDALVADARSLALVFDQLFRLHDGGEPDAAGDLPPVPARGADAAAVEAAWREKFADLPPGPPLGGGPGSPRVHRRFDLETWPRLRERAEEVGVPADVLLLTAYCDVLRDEFPEPFTVVVVSWDRPPGTEGVVGDFTGLAWLVVDDLPASFDDRARAVWARLREDRERSRVVDGVGPLRRQVLRSRGALTLPAVFTRLPAPTAPPPPPGVEVRLSQSRTAQVALDQVTMLVGDTLVCQWDAMADALPGDRLDTLFDRYADLVRALSAPTPARPAPVEKADGPEWTLPPLLERALAEHADREAVRSADESLTYRELDRCSAALAGRLHELGCRNGDLVGVHLERSADLVVALLAVVRTGAAYVPIDPADPAERTRFLLRDSGVRVVVSHDGTLPDVRVVAPRQDDAGPVGPPDVQSGPDDPVYMIYTSGTTGKPKGCPNSQRGVTNRLLWMRDTFRLTPDDRVVQKTPYGFDVSVWEFFLPLLTGACVVVARPAGHTDPGYLARLFRDERVTVAHFVPSMLGMFLRQPGADGCPDLRLVFASGEALPATTAERFFEVLPGTALHNLYGPTEAAIDVTHWACTPGWTGSSIPIGRPIANTTVHVLDEHDAPVPVGETGEIHLGGHGVALGYHRRPELEAERFVRLPAVAPGRLYRTGDLGRLDEDGVLWYLGRNDNQFKVRGLRVEAGEIETALAGVPGVADARVLPVDDPAGGQAIAALCVPDGDPPSMADLRDALGRTLPRHLLPSRVEFVAELPATANGKLDREAARALLAKGATAAPTVEPAAGVTAEDVASLAAPLLDGARVGVDDDLFDLGATSFTMIRLAQSILAGHGVEVPVDVLVERATPRGIADGVHSVTGSADAAADTGPDLRIALDAEAKARFAGRRLSIRVFDDDGARVPLDPPDPAAMFGTSSVRDFADEPVPLVALRALLSAFTEAELDGRPSRHYPSAGGFYPVQVYLHVKPERVEGLDGGLHYLDPVGRALVPLAPGADLGPQAHVRYNRPLVENAAFALFLVSTPAAIAPAYGTRLAERYTTVEAGSLAQLAVGRAASLGLGLCAVGDMDFAAVREHFAVDEDQDLIVSLWGGGLPAARRDRYRELAGPPGGEPVAVVGFAADLPGIDAHDTLDGLADLLAARDTAIGDVPTDRWPAGAVRTGRPGAAAGAYLADVTAFEAAEFGVADTEAVAMDPQERMLLQTVRACLDDAAADPSALPGPVGVFTAIMWQDHSLREGTHLNRGGLAHRVSHSFDFTGPSVVVDAACASGMAAIDAAVKAIRRGECTAAVAAAANLVLHPRHLDFLADTGLLAEDAGSCAFTERASGWIVGEGVAAVLLKPLSAALADGDPIHAVLRGSAQRHSGSTREYGLPSAARQVETMRSALADASLAPSAIDYVEAAASGAALADALETRGLDELFAGRKAAVPVGSVKPTLGHMEAASAFGQLAKVITQFRHGRVFPTRLTGEPNPLLHTEHVRLADQDQAWNAPARVLVNGFAGTGAYGCLVVESPPAPPEAGEEADDAQVLPLSADTPGLLATAAARLADRLDRAPDLPLTAVAATLRTRRDRACRAAVVADRAGAGEALRALADDVRAHGSRRLVSHTEPPDGVRTWLAGGEPTWPVARTTRAHLPATPVQRTRFAPPELPAAPAAPAAPSTSAAQTAPSAPSAPSAECGDSAPPTPASPQPPSGDPALDTLIELVAAESGIEAAALSEDADVIALGVDSRQLLRVARRIEIEHGRRVPLEVLYEAANLRELAALAFDSPSHT